MPYQNIGLRKMTVRKMKNGRGRLGGMWLPQGTLDDGILWMTNEDEPTKAQRAPVPPDTAMLMAGMAERPHEHREGK
jgi:hypothetical protein